MPDLHDLELLLRSDTPLLLIESLEEPRLVELSARLALRINEPAFCWTLTDGLRRLDIELPAQRQLAAPPDLLRHIRVTPQRGVYLLLDFHPFLADPLHVRLIKEIAQGYGELRRTLMFASHALEVPPEVRHLSARFRLRLPDRNRVLALIREEAQAWQHAAPRRAFRANREAIDQLSRNLLGVTESDARRLIRTAIRNDGAITTEDVKEVARAKYELLAPDGAVSFEYDTATFADIAGLDNLKAWLERRKGGFLGTTSVDPPKGILLLGVQGGGKSLAAKAVAGRFGVPLLRLDFGALYDKYYGETEKNLRRVLETAEVMAPCVLWMDEIEKGIASGGDTDGVGQRVLGSLLTWMAERKSAVFLVATANDISRLPPELIRKGRLDEIFFVDLPTPEVRERIFEIHLKRRGLDPTGFDLPLLAQASEGFSGAGIEQAVVSAVYAAESEDSPVSTETLLTELSRTQPLSVVMAEPIAELKEWASGRTVPAH
ncbi:MAG: AAA family ATPase [Chromatiaceae bacterium]|jgi:SpoVK/Ycf46/Vps4 family AAA+-type ATPase|nr:AAA family ATPase [Chromatiaceae bacterium]